MRAECNGKIIDCTLVRRKDGETYDHRNLAVCEKKHNCEVCTWNAEVSKNATYRFRKLNRGELARLKKEYGIKAKSLKCLERV